MIETNTDRMLMVVVTIVIFGIVMKIMKELVSTSLTKLKTKTADLIDGGFTNAGGATN